MNRADKVTGLAILFFLAAGGFEYAAMEPLNITCGWIAIWLLIYRCIGDF